MQLIIDRSQTIETDRKGRSQGATFRLACRLALDAHDRDVIERYALTNYPVVFLRTDELRDLEQRDSLLSLQRLVEQGFTYNTRFAGDALAAESRVRDGCKEFKAVLVMVESYGGHDEVDF